MRGAYGLGTLLLTQPTSPLEALFYGLVACFVAMVSL